MESMGTRLRRLRLEKGLGLKEICDKAAIPVSTYREWEYGREIKGEPYVKIAQILEVSVVELLTGEKPKSRKALRIIEELEENLKQLRMNLESFN